MFYVEKHTGLEIDKACGKVRAFVERLIFLER